MTVQQKLYAYSNDGLRRQSVGTIELYKSLKKRQHSFDKLKSFFFVRDLSEYETSDSDLKVNRNI